MATASTSQQHQHHWKRINSNTAFTPESCGYFCDICDVNKYDFEQTLQSSEFLTSTIVDAIQASHEKALEKFQTLLLQLRTRHIAEQHVMFVSVLPDILDKFVDDCNAKATQIASELA